MRFFHSKWHLPLSLAFLGCLAALLLLALDPGRVEEPRQHADMDQEPAFATAALETAPVQPIEEILTDTIPRGETASSLLGTYLDHKEIDRLARDCRPIFPLSRLTAGQPYRLTLQDGTFSRFEYDINADEHLIICRSGEEGFEIVREPIAYQVREEFLRGQITTNLFESVAAIGEQMELAIGLADLFAWDIDFIRDLRVGDSFQVVIEKRSREGQPAGYGRILAAEFENQGERYQAFLFQQGDRATYYDAEGQNIRKAFLKAPLSFTRISSGYSKRRFHPVTKTWRAHPAIDYAAPPGTPIKTVGDGTIVKIGYTKYNGNFIKIRHLNSFESLYLHMKGFARGMKRGKKLTQGQVIGYVGSTGLATGPHLCFRMYKNGAPVNPQSIKMAKAAPVPKEMLAQFKVAIAPYLTLFRREEEKSPMVASNTY